MAHQGGNIPPHSFSFCKPEPDNRDAHGAQAWPTKYGVDSPPEPYGSEPPEAPQSDGALRPIVYNARRISPLDYVSDSPRPPVFYCEAFTAPSNLQKHSYPDPAIANIQKSGNPPTMPYSHMGVYRGPEILGSYEDEDPPQNTDADAADGEHGPQRGLLLHLPSAPPPYPKPTDLGSWICDNHLERTPFQGPASAPLLCDSPDSYPTSMVSMDRPFKWIEDVTADQAIEADGFKRCSRCSISYRITDGKRCRCTPSDGDGERPV